MVFNSEGIIIPVLTLQQSLLFLAFLGSMSTSAPANNMLSKDDDNILSGSSSYLDTMLVPYMPKALGSLETFVAFVGQNRLLADDFAPPGKSAFMLGSSRKIHFHHT
ncbi:hypothetical protein KCP78_25820 (plasmid) [Salmonella enterica subsp. enterica]|nr:hypothetical protein KCP78_25820 [Salmonella enterica subsp. enterica]